MIKSIESSMLFVSSSNWLRKICLHFLWKCWNCWILLAKILKVILTSAFGYNFSQPCIAHLKCRAQVNKTQISYVRQWKKSHSGLMYQRKQLSHADQLVWSSLYFGVSSSDHRRALISKFITVSREDDYCFFIIKSKLTFFC